MTITNATAKKAVLPLVGLSAVNLLNALVALAAKTRAELDGAYGDVAFRMIGTYHALAACRLFPELYDEWLPQLVPVMQGDGWGAHDPAGAGLLWPQSRPVSWDENPQAFASQIAGLANDVVQIAQAWNSPPDLVGSFNAQLPGVSEPPEWLTTIYGYAYDYGEEAAGEAFSATDIPVVGWILLLVDWLASVIANALTTTSALFGQGPLPLTAAELKSWEEHIALSQLAIKKIVDECSSLGYQHGGILSAQRQTFALAAGATPQTAAAKNTRTAVVIVVGTGLAMLLVWAALA